MEKLKQTVTLTLLGTLALFAASWFLLIGPKRDEAAALREETATQVSANSTLATQLQVLKAQAKDLPKEQAKLAAVAAKIPSDPALPSLIRALLDASASTGVELVSITPGAPALNAAAAPAGGTAAAPVTAQEGVPGEPGASAPTAAPAGPAGVLANIPLTVNVVGDFFEVEQFVAALEDLPRALKVNNLTMAPGVSPTAGKSVSTAAAEDGRSLAATVSGFVYMAANAPVAAPVAVPGEPAAAPAPGTPATAAGPAASAAAATGPAATAPAAVPSATPAK